MVCFTVFYIFAIQKRLLINTFNYYLIRRNKNKKIKSHKGSIVHSYTIVISIRKYVHIICYRGRLERDHHHRGWLMFNCRDQIDRSTTGPYSYIHSSFLFISRAPWLIIYLKSLCLVRFLVTFLLSIQTATTCMEQTKQHF